MKGIDASYRYEGYSTYTMDELASELGGDGEGVSFGRMDDAPVSSGCCGNADE